MRGRRDHAFAPPRATIPLLARVKRGWVATARGVVNGVGFVAFFTLMAVASAGKAPRGLLGLPSRVTPLHFVVTGVILLVLLAVPVGLVWLAFVLVQRLLA